MLNLWSDDVSTTVRLWSLTDDALVEDGPDAGALTVVTRWGELEVRDTDETVVESLRRMAFGPVTLRNTLPRDGRDARSSTARAVLEGVLERIGGAVVHSVGLPDGQAPLMSVEPTVAEPRFRPDPVPAAATLRLSRLAALRPERGTLVLETPGTSFRVDLRHPLARAVVVSLVEPTDAARLATVVGVSEPVVSDMLCFLVAAGAVLVADARGFFAEDEDPGLRGWSHHELLFHQRSRTRGTRPEATGPAVPPAVTRPDPPGQRYPLYRPDMAALAASDPTLTTMLESDHRCPELSGEAVTARQVGEMLYRGARIRSTGPAHLPSVAGGAGHDASQRPYANIACLYELELYLTIGRCDGLPRGIYHYDPLGHALTMVGDDVDAVDAMLDIGRVGTGSVRRPAVLVTVAARTARVSWILPGAAYATALRHCGALQQTLYLSGKAVGLWAHAIPADAPGVERLLGMPWPAEVAIGECVVDLLAEPGRPAGTVVGSAAARIR